MTTNTDPAARAAQCRIADTVIPFNCLSLGSQAEIEFVMQNDGSALAIWRDGGEGEEPPPYWKDVDGKIHKL